MCHSGLNWEQHKATWRQKPDERADDYISTFDLERNGVYFITKEERQINNTTVG